MDVRDSNKDSLVLQAVRTRADKLASAGGQSIPEEDLLFIAEHAADRLPNGVTDVVAGAQLSGLVERAIDDTLREISQFEETSDKQAAHGGANMDWNKHDKSQLDYVDSINLDADKVASLHGPMGGAQYRLQAISEDVPSAVAALYEKTASLQDLVVKIASVVEDLSNKAAAQISADQGNADAVIQDGKGKDESTEEELDNLVKVTGEGTGTSYMEGDSTGEESKITKPGAKGAGGIDPNKKPTTGDIIAAARERSLSTKKLLQELKAKREQASKKK